MWRIALLAIVIPLVLGGCVNKTFPVTETYSETGYKTEYRTETVTETEKEIYRSGEEVINAYGWYNTGSTSGQWGSMCVTHPFWYFGYSIPVHSITSVEITSYSPFPDIVACDMGRIEEFARIGADPEDQEIRFCDWLDEYNNKYSSSRLTGKYSTTSDRTLLKIDTSGTRWLSVVVQGNSGGEYATFTTAVLRWADTRDKEVKRDQTVEVQVPVMVEKQRTVNQTRSVPFWAAF